MDYLIIAICQEQEQVNPEEFSQWLAYTRNAVAEKLQEFTKKTTKGAKIVIVTI